MEIIKILRFITLSSSYDMPFTCVMFFVVVYIRDQIASVAVNDAQSKWFDQANDSS